MNFFYNVGLHESSRGIYLSEKVDSIEVRELVQIMGST